MSFKKLLLVMLVVIVGMCSLMLTTSYAWYSFSEGSTVFDGMTSNEDITVTYQSGEYINTSIAVPISEEDIDRYSEKSNFNIKVNNNKEYNEIMVGVSLTDVSISSELQNSDFKIDLYYQGSLVKSTDGSSIITGDDIALDDVILNSDLTNMFEIRIYILDNGEDQGSMMNKQFSAKIKVDVISRLKTTLTDFEEIPDIYISNVTIDGEASDKLPTSGYYSMSSTCTKGSKLTWEPLSKTITYESGSYIEDSCSLTFISSTNYPKLSEMPVGSYVAYVGTGGMVGDMAVTCQNNGSASNSEDTAETESPNSCQGQNAREDLDENGNTYGYCYDKVRKFYTTGWRLAYVDGDNPVIISAGSPECNARPISVGNVDYIKLANTKAMKYCNSEYVDGSCVCYDDDNDGLCDNASSVAWAVNDYDYYNMTKAISGVGKRLTNGSSNLGDSGGYLGEKKYCTSQAYLECGYGNDLIDNGSYYWFASRYAIDSENSPFWGTYIRVVYEASSSNSYGLRPVISLSSNVVVTGGAGTMEDPYQIKVRFRQTNNEFAETYMISNAISDSSVDFSKSSNETATNGIYVRNETENDDYPIYYYRGVVDNNLIFANFCWKVVRTTETGGLKLIYNGVPTDGKCNNTGEASQIGISTYNSNTNPSYVGYMYGDVYSRKNMDLSSDTTAYVYGNDVSYNDGTYTLTGGTISGDWSNVYETGFTNHHYTCFTTGTTCTNVYYIYNIDVETSTVRSITLNGVNNIQEALSNMLDKNITSTTIKGNSTTEGTIDFWYYNNIENTEYKDYIEDTVWCNDRSIYSLGGWDPNGEVIATNITNGYLRFAAFNRIRITYSPDLSCARNIDKFTVSENNGNGDLDYPVGLLTADEAMLAGLIYAVNGDIVSSNYLNTGQYFWTISPYYFSNAYANEFRVGTTGYLSAYGTAVNGGIRPSISLKKGFTIADGGDGTVNNPYVVE